MHTHTQAKLAAALLAVLVVTGCSVTPRMRVIDVGGEVAVVDNVEAGELEVLTGSDAAAQGAMAGGSAGLATGAMAGLTCGPFAPACVPVAGLSLAAIGAIGGSIVAAATSLDEEEEAAVLEQLNLYLAAEDLDLAFRRRLGEQLSPRWTVVSESTNVLAVALTAVAIRGEANGRIKLVLQAEAYAESCRGCRNSQRADAVFVHDSRGILAKDWIANGGGFVESEMHLAFDGLACQIESAMAKRQSARTERARRPRAKGC